MTGICTTCRRDPAQVNNRTHECSHGACPCRKDLTAGVCEAPAAAPETTLDVDDAPLAALFDDPLAA